MDDGPQAVFAAIGVIVVGCVLLCGVVLLGIVIKGGIDASDKASCLDWQQQAKSIAPWSDQNPGGFYITQSEKDQCDYWHIDTGAVVHTSAD